MLSLHSKSISALRPRHKHANSPMFCTNAPVSCLQHGLEHESDEDHSVADGLGGALAVDQRAAQEGEGEGGG